ncbi:MAG: cysteine synthase A [bacterium]|jgi:cysteine synthase A
MNVFSDNSLSIGNTPLVHLQKIGGNTHANLYAKIEGRNPAYSVKSRIGASMIWAAEKSGDLTAGKTIVEPTSGNTGIALSYVAAARGYNVILTMPDTMSLERRKLLKIFGADLLLTDGALGMKGAIDKAVSIVQSNPDQYYMPQQFSNPANPKIHEETTGPEIWNDLDGNVDIFIAGVGTGGTITGVSRFFKKIKGKAITTIAVEPTTSPVISQTLANKPLRPGPHKIQGIGAGFIPSNLDLDLIDEVELVSSDESMEAARQLAKEEGILAGISSGAAVAAALKVANKPENKGKNIVLILPDSGERYLSTELYADILQ